MGFADTIRPLASLIVLGCSIAGRTGENAFGKDKNSVANAISLRGALGPQRTLLDAVMAWRWSAPAFLDGMPDEPIWSLQWRAHSASRRRAPWRSKSWVAAPTLATARRSLRRRLSVSDRSDAL
jgi:hypothetical protein